MIPMPAGTQIWVACGTTDMRKGFDGLAMLVQDVLKKAAHSGHLFVFRGKRADRIKILWWDGTGLCLYAKRLERGRFVWPLTREGAAILTQRNCRCCARVSIGVRRSVPMLRCARADALSERVIVNLTNIVFIGSR